MQTNGLPAARAAGRLMTAAENATREKMEAEEKKRREEEEARMSTGMKVLNGVVALFSYGSELLGEMVNPVVAGPSGGVVEAEHDGVLCEKHPPNPIQFMAEGSSQVSINGLPAVRAGDRTTCGGTVSSLVSPNVIIGGKPVVVRPIHSGNRTSVQLPDGRSLKTLYYGSGHALSISLDERLITEFTRDNLHREISRTQGGLTMRTRYDRLGRQARREIYRKENGMRPAEAWHWQYDSRHNLLSETQISDYRYQGYHYDDGDRVSHHDTSFRGVTHHMYDAAGNLLTASQAGLSLKHNRQTQCGNGACRYDVYGRMVQKTGPGGLWRYGYDSEHRMKEAVLDTPDAAGAGNTRHRVTFTYDPFGRRTEKRSVVTVSAPDDDGVTVTQEVTTFVWEGFRLLGETRNGQALVYVYEGAGSYTPLARIYDTGDKQRVDYYRCSHNGMPQALTDEDGKLHWRQDVETWGETRSEYADEEGNRWRKKWGGAPEENLRFAGQYLDRETGLHYNTFRYYAPDMGRFITPDPIGLAGGINLYQYAPIPLSWIDPLGLDVIRVYHYTSKDGYNGIMGSGTIKTKDPGARAKGSIQGKPQGVYVTTLSPDELKSSGLRGKMGLTKEKSTHFISFEIESSKVKRVDRQNGYLRLYIEEEIPLRDANNKLRGDVKHGTSGCK
ncbi:TPA: RHS domain-containing protein [Citrobacter sedlakii]|nr:RHS domain-containing protein [Citrobacter sedlakii]